MRTAIDCGGVGTLLDEYMNNIKFMQVASLNEEERERGEGEKGVEALMVLRVQSPNGKVEEGVLGVLRKSVGVLNVGLVQLRVRDMNRS